MNIHVTKLNRSSSPAYPYTHRIGIPDRGDWLKVRDWVYENNIPCTPIAGTARCFYFNEKYTAWFLLKWA